MNAARSVLLATSPPPFAAASNTACGRALANQPNTAASSRKSTSLRLTLRSSTSSLASLRPSALPTMPRCPATKTCLPFSSTGVLAIGNLAGGNREIARHHFLDELRKARLRLPAELLARLAGVADQEVDFGRAEIYGIDANHRLAGFLVDAGLLDALAAPFDAAADFRTSHFGEFAHRAGFAGRHHEIIGPARLQYPLHPPTIIPGMTQ